MGETPDPLVEKVARAIQQVRERNGGPAYDAFDVVFGPRTASRVRAVLFEEAEAAVQAIKQPT